MTERMPALPRLALLALPLLAGCANSPVLDLLGGGAGLPGPGEASGQIRRATGEGGGWPNLATVPPRPTGVRTPAQRQALIDELVREREEVRSAGAALDARGAQVLAAPAAIPPLSGDVPPAAEALPVPAAPPGA